MEDILLSNLSNEIVKNVLLQFGVLVSNPQVNILESSSTNIILSIDNQYVVKCKNIESHRGVLHLLDQLLREVNRICGDIYMTTQNGRIFICEEQKIWFVMNYVCGDEFKFGNDKQIVSVAKYIKSFSMHNFYNFEIIKDELKKIQAPKNDINLIFNSPTTFFDNYSKDIKDIISSTTNYSEILREVYNLVDDIIRQDCDCSQFDYGFSHGEIQGQNVIFNDNNIRCAIDWDSVGIRPIIYDVAMGICFFCRKSRGQFIIDENNLSSYIKEFKEIKYVEKSNIFNSMLIGFIPDRNTILSYAIDDKEKATWYLKWSLDSIQQLKQQELIVKSTVDSQLCKGV